MMVLRRQLIFLMAFIVSSICAVHDRRLKVITFADGGSDGYRRFIRSCRTNNLDVRVTGLDKAVDPMYEDVDWKILALRKSLRPYVNYESLIVLITEAHDSIVQLTEKEILDRFEKFNSNIVLSTDSSKIEQQGLQKHDHFLELSLSESNNNYSTKGIIGYAAVLYKLFTSSDNHAEDFERYMNFMYKNYKEKYRINLDYSSDIFHILNGDQKKVELEFIGKDVSIIEKITKRKPAVVSAKIEIARSMMYLNHMSNYVPKVWTYEDGCIICNENKISLEYSSKMAPVILIKKEKWPTVLIGVFITSQAPFVDLLLQQISELDYPKSKIHLFVHNTVERYDVDIEDWINKVKHSYRPIEFIPSRIYMNERDGKNSGVFLWRKLRTEYYLSIDGTVSLTNRDTLRLLIEQNRGVLAPLLKRIDNSSCNFFGNIALDGSFDSFEDHSEILNGKRRGLWNSAYIANIYLLHWSILDTLGREPFYDNYVEIGEPDASFSAHLTERGIFMYVTNVEHYGHLKSLVNLKADHAHNDLFELFDNRRDWEIKYLHPDYLSYLNNSSQVQQPCRDVYWVPIVTRKFAKDLIDECEAYGKWSDGTHNDQRLDNGYEEVPTIDIHMNQIGFEKHWLHMLERYFAPFVRRLYRFASKSYAHLNFVVKYTVDGQSRLMPHHDASTYTVNMALNERHVEYEGGGARFIRLNCSVPDTRVGWALLHPGQLTHYHEGLKISRGTRYIMVSFVDP